MNDEMDMDSMYDQMGDKPGEPIPVQVDTPKPTPPVAEKSKKVEKVNLDKPKIAIPTKKERAAAKKAAKNAPSQVRSPAQPTPDVNEASSDLRNTFAAAALQGLLFNWPKVSNAATLAEWSFTVADEMLKEMKK